MMQAHARLVIFGFVFIIWSCGAVGDKPSDIAISGGKVVGAGFLLELLDQYPATVAISTRKELDENNGKIFCTGTYQSISDTAFYN